MHSRQVLLAYLANIICALPATDGVVRVAIDGVDGAGKTYFADELANMLQTLGRSTIRASVDGFHNPKAVRYRRGRRSPQGFFLDSYNYGQLKQALLDPLIPGGTLRYRTEIFDHKSDTPTRAPELEARPGDILVFDGIFLHRPEIRTYRDYSIFLDVPFEISIPRGAQRDGGVPDPGARENERYIEGQKLYLQTCDPKRFATVIVNNEDLSWPYIVDDRN